MMYMGKSLRSGDLNHLRFASGIRSNGPLCKVACHTQRPRTDNSLRAHGQLDPLFHDSIEISTRWMGRLAS